MDRIRNNDGVLLNRMYNMVDDPATDSIASWSQSGKTFIIWNPLEFTRHVMLYHKLTKSMPFILSFYGFRRVGSHESHEFANDNFVRGQPQLMKNIPREGFFMDRVDMINQINILSKEKEELLSELQKQELQINELKYHLQQRIGICKL